MLFVHDLARGIAGLGCFLVLLAGWIERRGDLRGARRLARRGGFIAATGAAAQAASALFLPGAAGSALPLAASAGAALASGFVALLAGLSGKPRPSGFLAALLWLASLFFHLAHR